MEQQLHVTEVWCPGRVAADEVQVRHQRWYSMTTLSPAAVPSPTWSMSIVISALAAMDASLMTAAVAAVTDVFSVLSIVSFVDRIVVPASLMSTVKIEPDACAVVRLARTESIVMATLYGFRN